MSKLTLFFNNKAIDTFNLEQTVSTIGRDALNTFCIDSLAVAPQHFKISLIADKYLIESLTEQFPILINDKPIRQQVISPGEKISVGKHTLYLSHTENQDFAASLASAEKNASLNQKADSNLAKTGNLQIMNGAEIGRVITLNKAVTELKQASSTTAIIAKRQHGFFISRIADDVSIDIDGQAISTETKLNNNAKIRIANNKYTFFTE